MLRLQMDVDGTPVRMTLDDSAASQDFVSLLPLEITLEDYAATEKVSDLPRRLSISGAPAGMAPAKGDVTYYAPWGNLAIFYKHFGYAKGLVKLGTIDSGMDALRRAASLRTTIRLTDD